MSRLKDKITKISGSFSWVANCDELCIVARAVNRNADVLEELLNKIEKLEKQIADMRGDAE